MGSAIPFGAQLRAARTREARPPGGSWFPSGLWQGQPGSRKKQSSQHVRVRRRSCYRAAVLAATASLGVSRPAELSVLIVPSRQRHQLPPAPLTFSHDGLPYHRPNRPAMTAACGQLHHLPLPRFPAIRSKLARHVSQGNDALAVGVPERVRDNPWPCCRHRWRARSPGASIDGMPHSGGAFFAAWTLW